MPDLISNEIFRNRSGLRRRRRRLDSLNDSLSEKESESVNPNLRVAAAATKPRETMVGITAAEAVNEIKI